MKRTLQKYVSPIKDYEAVEDSIVNQIKDYVTNEAKSEACIVWVSWWVDSAVVSTLAAKTWLKTVLLTMPIHQAIDQVTRADTHIAELQKTYPNIIHKNIDLTDVYNSFENTLIQSGEEKKELYMWLLNSRARLRMSMLYALTHKHKWLVIGTWNKIEDYWIWFFTKFWDGWVDYSPIGDLAKIEVRRLGKHMWVIQEILEAAPTDWLHDDGATDEEQIKATYTEMEDAMYTYDKFKQERASQSLTADNPEVVKEFIESFEWRDYEVMKIYLTRHFQNKHKMKVPDIATIPGA